MNLTESIAKYRSMVFSIAIGYVKNSHDADDIAQNVFLKLYQHFQKHGGFPTEGDEKAWLVRVTVNEAKDLLKSAWRTKTCELDTALIDESMHARDEFRDCELDLYDYLQRLNPKYRTVLYLYYYEGYSTKEIAAFLKITQGTVTSQLKRSREQLKEIIVQEDMLPCQT